MTDRRRFIGGAIASGMTLAVADASAHEVRKPSATNGRVTGEGKPIEGVVVSDGRNCTLTDKDGKWSLPANERIRFIAITVPAGWRIPKHYIRYSTSLRNYDFDLTSWAASAKDGFSFMHIGDSEISNDVKLESSWVARAKKLADEKDCAFFVHTGDICMTLGDLHYRIMNEEIVGRPVFYVVGNHDIIKEEYGEEIFEEVNGPCWYSFDCGTTHFIVTPMMWGDGFPSYKVAHIEEWLKNDLAIAKQKKQGVISLVHGPHDNGVFNSDWLYDREQLTTLGPEKLDIPSICDFHGIVHGHFHVNYYKRSVNRKIEVISGAPPLKQMSTLQVIKVDDAHRMHCHNQYGHVTWPKVPEPKECVWRHDVGASVSHSAPAIDDLNVYVGTLDICGNDSAGVFALDRTSGNKRWFYHTSSQVKTRVIVHEGKVYAFEEDWVLHCLDPQTGKVIWKFDAKDHIGATGHRFGGGSTRHTNVAMTLDAEGKRIFVGHACNQLFAVNIADGKPCWRPADIGNHFLATSSAPAIGDGVVVASSQWMGLYGYDLETRKTLWFHKRNNSSVTSEWYRSGYPWIERMGFPVIREGKLYLITGNEFMEVNLRTGEPIRRHKFKFSLTCYSEPVFYNGCAYFGTPRNGLVCFDMAKFVPKWIAPVEEALMVTLPYQNPPMRCLSSIPVVWNGLIWASCMDGAIYAWNPQSGERVKRIETGVPLIASVSVGHDNRLYSADFLGTVRCFT